MKTRAQEKQESAPSTPTHGIDTTPTSTRKRRTSIGRKATSRTASHEVSYQNESPSLSNGVGVGERVVVTSTTLLPVWIQVWLVFSSIVCALDSIFTSWRPKTLPDGEWGNATVWQPWHLYCTLDHRYADTTDSFTLTSGRVMWVEIAMNIIALVLAHRRCPNAVMVTFTTTVMTFWKTVIFLGTYIRPPPGEKDYFSHNYEGPVWRQALLFWTPNGTWLLLPALVLLSLAPRLNAPFHHSLRTHTHSRP